MTDEKAPSGAFFIPKIYDLQRNGGDTESIEIDAKRPHKWLLYTNANFNARLVCRDASIVGNARVRDIPESVTKR